MNLALRNRIAQVDWYVKCANQTTAHPERGGLWKKQEDPVNVFGLVER